MNSSSQLPQTVRLAVLLVLFLVVGQLVLGQKTDTIVLYNGDRLVGEIKEMTLGKLKYSTEKMGTIYIEWNGINYIRSSKLFELRSSGGSVYFCNIDKAEDHNNILLISNSDTLELDKDRVVELTRIKKGFWNSLDGAVDLGLTQTKANDLLQLSFGFNTTYRTRHYFNEIAANSLITDQADRDTQRKQDVSISIVRYLGGRGALGGRVSAEQNTELGLDLRASTTVFGGVDLLHTNRNLFLPSAGLVVNREISNGKEDATDNIEGLVQILYKAFSYDNPELSIDAFVQLFPSFTVAKRYRFNSDLKVSYEILNDLFLGISFYYQYDNKPPNSEAASNDYSTQISLGYSW